MYGSTFISYPTPPLSSDTIRYKCPQAITNAPAHWEFKMRYINKQIQTYTVHHIQSNSIDISTLFWPDTLKMMPSVNSGWESIGLAQHSLLLCFSVRCFAGISLPASPKALNGTHVGFIRVQHGIMGPIRAPCGHACRVMTFNIIPARTEASLSTLLQVLYFFK